jgi:hypothetical protein
MTLFVSPDETIGESDDAEACRRGRRITWNLPAPAV